MKNKLPKFHDRKSLLLGVLASLFLVISGLFHGILIIGLMQVIIGGVLGIHCFDMVRYYNKHRIIRIVKTEHERLVYK